MTQKKCSKCKLILPFSSFAFDRKNKDGYNYNCKKCYNKHVRDNYNPEKKKGHHLKTMYGIDLEQYKIILESQNNSCAICETKTPGGNGNYFYVDHNHKTGQVRGLLCHRCNFLIGQALEDIDILKSSVKYLRKWGSKKLLQSSE